MDSREPIIHTQQGSNHQIAIEYFLPKPNIPDSLSARLPLWFLDIATLSQSDLSANIRKRFAEANHPELQPLCKQLQSYMPRSIVIQHDMQCFLRLLSNHEEQGIGSSALLPAPPDPVRIQSSLTKVGFSDNIVFSEFMMHFAGLAEDFSVAGNFITETEEWSTISEEWHEEIINNYKEWYGSLLFYHARNGDNLLLHPEGYVGWWRFAEGFVTQDFDSFTEFIIFYVNYRYEFSYYPLDSYGPPE